MSWDCLVINWKKINKRIFSQMQIIVCAVEGLFFADS